MSLTIKLISTKRLKYLEKCYIISNGKKQKKGIS